MTWRAPVFACRQGLTVALLALLLALLVAPGQAQALDRPPARRLLSLGPSLTELVFALGLGDRLVGRTGLCNHPPEASRIPVVGTVAGWSEERVVSLHPDVILALEGARGPVERLAGLTGARLVVLPTQGLADIGRHAVTIAGLAGMPERGRRWAASLDAALAARRRQAAQGRRPSVFYMVWDDPLMTASPRSYLGELISLAGGRNVVPDSVPGAYPTFGWEAFVASDPEVVVAPQDREAALRTLAQRHPRLQAVKAGRLRTVPDDLVSRPGPRVLQALDALTRAIRPRP